MYCFQFIFLALCSLVIASFRVDVRKIGELGILSREFSQKPFWQSSEEIQDRLSSEGQFHMSDSVVDTSLEEEIESLEKKNSKRQYSSSGPVHLEHNNSETRAGQKALRRRWPPPHCKGSHPAYPPKVKNVEYEKNTDIFRRKLLSEAPTELLLDKNPPDAKFQEEIYDYIRNFMASPTPCTYGKCPEAIDESRVGKLPVYPWPCIFRTQNEQCSFKEEGKYKLPPALRKDSLGTCAFIGTGDQLLQAKFGDEIDAHDTVIRYNTPIKGFERNVGTKTTLMFVKGHYKTSAKPKLGYFEAKVPLPKGSNVDAIDTDVGMRPMRTLRNELVNIWLKRNKIKDGKPAAGLMRTQMLVKSGLCTSVDLYGFSTKGSVRSGKYFDKKAIVTKGHTIDWDGWILSAMMDLGYICVYGS
jgi:hypothetical protein